MTLVERLDCLHVWPQSVAFHYADTLTPRQIKELYAVGAVATEAKWRIERLEATLRKINRMNDHPKWFRSELKAVIDKALEQSSNLQTD